MCLNGTRLTGSAPLWVAVDPLGCSVFSKEGRVYLFTNCFDYKPISAVLSAGVYLGCLTLPSASGLQQLEGDVHWDKRDPGTP